MADVAAQKKGVRTQHPDYIKYAPKWQRCRDAMAGQDAVHLAGPLYLPRLKEQDDESYKAYKWRANWYNASWRTVAGLNGMMFRKPPKQEVPKGVEPFLDNIDMQGTPFDEFSQAVSCDVLEVGRIGLLVDHPAKLEIDAPLTKDVAEKAGLRPTIKIYATETIINWKFRNINNKTVLSMVVLTEEYAEPEDEFSDNIETRYRVLDLDENDTYRVRVFRINKDDKDEQVGEDVTPLMNNKPLDYIPFVFCGPDSTRAQCDEPPLIDLVDTNFSHYRANADYKHGLHFTALPTPWVAGWTASKDASGAAIDKLYIGSQSAWTFQDPTTKVGYLEFTGGGLTSLKDYLDGTKQEMATLGARMLADTSTRQVETFGATAIKHVAENSILASISISVSRAIKTALTWFAQWAGADGKITYDINRDFMPVQMDAPTLTAYMAAWQNGALSEPELFDLLKRGDVIEAEKTLEEHQAEIDATPPPAPPSNVQPGALGTMTPEEKAAHDANAAKQLVDAVPPPVKKAA